MKKNEFDVTGWSLKEYRDKFGKEVSLDVVRRAYGYSKNGHLPQNALATSAVFYVKPFQQHDFLQLGLMAEKELNAVTIWNLQTETVAAQRALLHGEWDFHNRPMCVARLGENYVCTRRTTLDFPSELIIGVYVHQHRFVAVVSLEQKPESALGIAKVQNVADVLAKNALAHYTVYNEKKLNREWNISCGRKNVPELPDFKEFLLSQPMRFVEGLNNENSIFYNPNDAVNVGEYLKQRSKELNQQLSIASVDVFGKF